MSCRQGLMIFTLSMQRIIVKIRGSPIEILILRPKIIWETTLFTMNFKITALKIKLKKINFPILVFFKIQIGDSYLSITNLIKVKTGSWGSTIKKYFTEIRWHFSQKKGSLSKKEIFKLGLKGRPLSAKIL